MSEELTTPTLPDVPESTIDRMEDEIFARIAQDRSDDLARHRRHRRRTAVGWTAAAAAAVVVAGVAVPVALGVGSSGADSTASSADAPAISQIEPAADAGFADESTNLAEGARIGADMAAGGSGTVAQAKIIQTASIDLQVTDVAAAAASLAAYAESVDGFVESQSIGTSGDAATSSEGDKIMPYPTYSYVSLRIPADGLAAAQVAISEEGTVLNSTVNRSDVTTSVIDLEAQVAQAQASVDRLTELVASAQSVGDLITAETALADRRAMLDSYQQQLTYYNDQVAMSTVTVNLSVKQTATANPGGFGSGVEAGWNGLIASMNAIVVALGFALPWLGIIAMLVLIIWLVRRAVRARKPRTEEFDG